MNKSFQQLSASVLVLGGLLPMSSMAHDTWLSSAQRVTAGKPLQFDMTSGEHFPVPGTAIARERIELASCSQHGRPFELKAGRRQAKVLELHATPPAKEGVSCIVKLAPRKLDLEPGKVQEYLDEIDAPQAVRDAWKASPEPKRWVETYTKNARVIVPSRSGRRPAAADSSTGLNLEFVPEQNLTEGVVTGPLKVTLLRNGRPLAGISVSLSGTDGPPQRQRSDPAGKVTFPQPAPGNWMLSSTDLRLVDASQSLWESQFATMVFEVLESRR